MRLGAIVVGKIFANCVQKGLRMYLEVSDLSCPAYLYWRSAAKWPLRMYIPIVRSIRLLRCDLEVRWTVAREGVQQSQGDCETGKIFKEIPEILIPTNMISPEACVHRVQRAISHSCHYMRKVSVMFSWDEWMNHWEWMHQVRSTYIMPQILSWPMVWGW